MGRPFRRTRSGGVAVKLERSERAVLARLLDDTALLLREPDGGQADLPGTGAAPADLDDPLAALEASLAAPPPADPAVRRLLPDGSRDDPELAESFRRLTEPTLRERKRSALSTASAALGRAEPVVLGTDEAQALLKGLTDVRLVLAERLGLRTDEDAEMLHRALMSLDEDGPDAAAEDWVAAAAVYDALTWWQESLISALR